MVSTLQCCSLVRIRVEVEVDYRQLLTMVLGAGVVGLWWGYLF
jgi:hypothetical protein